MTGPSAAQVRVLAFGDPDGRLWAAAFDAGEPILVVGNGDGASVAVPLEPAAWTADGSGWRLAGDGLELHAEPAGEEEETTPAAVPDGAVTGVQDLCRVRGRITLGGAERSVDCVGVRSALDGVDVASLGSVRAVSGWLADDEAFMLLALRRGRSGDQESELVAATLFEPDGWVTVNDPRLSTTYDASGSPTRATLELWVGDGETEFPRRAAGECAGAGASVAAGGGRLRVVPLRCHSRGRDGAGAYVLLTR